VAYVLCMYFFIFSINFFLYLFVYVWLYYSMYTYYIFNFFLKSNFEIIMFLVGNKMPCDKLFLLEVVRFSLYHQKCTLHMGSSLSTCLRLIKDCSPLKLMLQCNQVC
jgi:hypothetical protein